MLELAPTSLKEQIMSPSSQGSVPSSRQLKLESPLLDTDQPSTG